MIAILIAAALLLFAAGWFAWVGTRLSIRTAVDYLDYRPTTAMKRSL